MSSTPSEKKDCTEEACSQVKLTFAVGLASGSEGGMNERVAEQHNTNDKEFCTND